MIKALLFYLLIGVCFMWFLETFWDKLELGDDEMELNWAMRIEVILLWPIPVISAILGIFFSNGDDTAGPGYGT